MQSKIIAVDFDGTLCENKWPDIGEPNTELIIYLKNQQNLGAKLILWTCRAEDRLERAVAWCIEQGLIFDGVNENLPEIIELFGSDTRKIYADEYIDDKMFGFFDLPYKSSTNFLRKQFHFDVEHSPGIMRRLSRSQKLEDKTK